MDGALRSPAVRSPGGVLFALTVAALGVLGLIFDRFAEVWQPVPKWVPAQEALAYACGALMLACGVGLLFAATARAASAALFVYLVAWVVLLEVPPIVAHPTVEASWGAAGEIFMFLGGGWVLFAPTGGGVRIARLLVVFGAVTVGLEHIIYADATAHFVPSFIPFPFFWAIFTGAAHLAAGAGMLLGVFPRLAATLETAMISLFTLLVWVPGFLHKPTEKFQWTGFLISSVLGFAVWVVAETYRDEPWLSVGRL